MKRTVLLCYSLLAFLMAGVFYSCLQDEMLLKNGKVRRFFNWEGFDETLSVIVEHLNLENDSLSFVDEFIQRYGFPLWQDACAFREGGNLVYAVPVRSVDSYLEIESIWYFIIGKGHVEYCVYTRRMADSLTEQLGGSGIDETWQFDYFTYHVLHRFPKSGIVFMPIENNEVTRSEIVIDVIKCVQGFVAVGEEDFYSEDIKEPHCWSTTEVIMVDDVNSDYFVGGFYAPVNSGGRGEGGMGSEDADDTDSDSPFGDDDPFSPCVRAQRLSSDAVLKSKVNDLFNRTVNYRVGDTEDGWIKISLGKYIYPSTRKVDALSYSSLSLTGQTITEEYHNHPTGLAFLLGEICVQWLKGMRTGKWMWKTSLLVLLAVWGALHW